MAGPAVLSGRASCPLKLQQIWDGLVICPTALGSQQIQTVAAFSLLAHSHYRIVLYLGLMVLSTSALGT